MEEIEEPRSPTKYLNRELPPLPPPPSALPSNPRTFRSPPSGLRHPPSPPSPPKAPKPLQIRKPSEEMLDSANMPQTPSQKNPFKTPSPRNTRSGSVSSSATNQFPPRSDSITPTTRRHANSTPRYRGRMNTTASETSSIFGHFRALSPSKESKHKESVSKWLGDATDVTTQNNQQSPDTDRSLDAIAQVRQILRGNPSQSEFPRMEHFSRMRSNSGNGQLNSQTFRSDLDHVQRQGAFVSSYSLAPFQASRERSQSRIRDNYLNAQAYLSRSEFADPGEDARTLANTNLYRGRYSASDSHLHREDSGLLAPGAMPAIIEVQSPVPLQATPPGRLFAPNPLVADREHAESETRTWSPSSFYSKYEDDDDVLEPAQYDDTDYDDYHRTLREDINSSRDNELNLDEYHHGLRKEARDAKRITPNQIKENQMPIVGGAPVHHGHATTTNTSEARNTNDHKFGTSIFGGSTRRLALYPTQIVAPSIRSPTPTGSQYTSRARSPVRSPLGHCSARSERHFRGGNDFEEQSQRSIRASLDIFRGISPIRNHGALGVQLPQSTTTGSFGRSTVIVDVPEEPIIRTRSPMKDLFGPRGWLGVTASPSRDEPSEDKYRKRGMGAKLKELSEKAGLSPRKAQAPFPVHIQQNVEISVTRDKQAMIYMELELCLCTTTNNFLILQLREGRIGEIVSKRAAEWWRSKGRTDVLEFQYDQSTQRDIIIAHQNKLQFYGQNSYNAVRRNSVLMGWKTLIKEMTIRNFCTADHIIERQLNDAYGVLELLGGTAEILTGLGDMISFLDHQVLAKRDNPRRSGIKVDDTPPLLWDPESPFLACIGQATPNPFTPLMSSSLRTTTSVDEIHPKAHDMVQGHRGFSKWRKHLNL